MAKKLIVNVTPEQHTRWKSAAHKAEMTLSEFVREAVDARVHEMAQYEAPYVDDRNVIRGRAVACAEVRP